MSPAEEFAALFASGQPVTVLAPMQDVTNLEFCHLMAKYGGPDLYFTEYFRVTDSSILYPEILRSITENPTGKPVIAQMIGNSETHLARTARELQNHPVVAVDLNLGCPAPVVYRKCAGGGLLRNPQLVDRILGTLRDAIEIPFTVKTRIGFDDPAVFDELLPIFAKHSLDLLTVHARTVKEMYRSEVHYEYIAQAAAAMDCPVIANGNVHSAENAEKILQETNAAGLMIGRGAIRNPWLFHQIRQRQNGEPIFVPRGHDVLEYIQLLYEAVTQDSAPEHARVQRVKKHLNYLGVGVDAEGQFLHRIRRCDTEANFFQACADFLDHDEPMPLTPFSATVANSR